MIQNAMRRNNGYKLGFAYCVLGQPYGMFLPLNGKTLQAGSGRWQRRRISVDKAPGN